MHQLIGQLLVVLDQREERFSMYALKAYMLPRLYWHGMLRGRA